MTMRKVALALVLALPFAAAGCEVSIGGKSVKKSEVEQKISEYIATQNSSAPKSVTCPDDLKAKVDTTMDCDVEGPDGSTLAVTVTVNSVKDGTANFSMALADDGSADATEATASDETAADEAAADDSAAEETEVTDEAVETTTA